MKRLMLASACLLLTARFLTAQDSLPRQKFQPTIIVKDHDYYFEKSKTLIPTGFVLIGVGIAATIGGIVGINENFDLFTNDAAGYVILWAAGIATLSTGIPLLIKGFVYKHKAKLLLKNENVYHSYHVPIKANILSAGIAISF